MSVDTSGEINFYIPKEDGPLPWIDATPTIGYNQLNYAYRKVRVPISDVRGKENDFHLDINGFELHKYDGNIQNIFEDDSQEQQCYFEDITNMLKNLLGASRVVIFDHVVRFRGPLRPADQCDYTHKNPVFYPHVDNNPPSAIFKVKQILGREEAEKVMKNRFQIINVWRPLGANPIINNPLTICDYQSLDLEKDIHVAEVRGSKVTATAYTLSQNVNDAQKWYYCSDMRSNEMFVFKIFDSNSNVAQFGAHTAFTNENASSTGTKQSSIEIRSLVFYDQ